MDFGLNQETTMLKNNAERFLKEKCPGSFVKKILKEEPGFSPSLYKEMADLGWLGLIYDEKYGGSGGQFLDLFILFQEIGKAVLPSPFFCSAVLAGMLIREAGPEAAREKFLPAIITGEKIVTVGLQDEQGKYDHARPALEAKEAAGGHLLNGTRILVPYAHVAEAVIVCAQVSGKKSGPTLFLIDLQRAGLKKTPLQTLSEEKSFAVTFENVKASAQDILGEAGKGAEYIEKILPQAITLKCGEMAGGSEKVLNMTVEYMKQRVQFGKPLGTLQVVHHYCADMSILLEGTRLIAGQAASLINEGAPCAKEVAMAKAWCSDAYKRITQVAHQLHGGIGFTEEHDLHLYSKHAKESELAFGDSFVHRAKVL